MSWKKDLTVKKIINNISDVHDLYTDYVNRVDEYKNIIEAKYKVTNNKGKSKVRPKVIKKLHNYTYSALSEGLLSDYDVVEVSPRGSNDRVGANSHNLLLNYQINEEMNFAPVVEKASVYFEDYGSFYLKLSWNYKERKVKTRDYEYVQLPEGIDPAQLQQLEATGMIENGLLKVPKEITKVVNDHPTIALKRYNQIILGPSNDGSNDIDSLEFIADKYYSTIASLRATGKYKNLNKVYYREDESTDYNIDGLPDSDFQALYEDMIKDDTSPVERTKLDDNKAVVVTEYWTRVDIDGKGTIRTVVVTYVAGIIIGQEISPFGEEVGYPYARGAYSPSMDDELYDGVPDTKDLEEDQLVYGAVSRGLIDILGSVASGQVGVVEGFLNPAEFTKLQSGQNYRFNPSFDPSKAIYHTKFPELPVSGLQMLDIASKSMESTSGKKMFGEGLNSNSYGDVASGINAVVDATTQRLTASVRKFNRPFVSIFKKLAELNKEFITDDKIIVLSDGSYETIRNDTLQTDINIKVGVSTPELDDKKARDLGFIMQTLGDTVDHTTKHIILADIARLKKRPDLAVQIENIPEPQPSQMEVEIHQLQVELLKAQIQNEYAQAEENVSDSTLKDAKANTEVAKTQVLMSNKDLQDLDFLQKKAGTDEIREARGREHQHTLDLEQAMMGGLIKSTEKGENEIKHKVPNKTDDTKIPVIDTPKESLQPSDLKK